MTLMLELDGQRGGPVFKDQNHDGRTEWIFDDFCYYGRNPYVGPEDQLVDYEAYKETRDGKLKFWKRIGGPESHHQMPYRQTDLLRDK